MLASSDASTFGDFPGCSRPPPCVRPGIGRNTHRRSSHAPRETCRVPSTTIPVVIHTRLQVSGPVAVCHIHRRRGVLWRDMLQSRIDPRAGFGEYLLSQGLARLREEQWWAAVDSNSLNPASAAAASTLATSPASAQTHHHRTGAASTGWGGDDSEQPVPALERLLEDHEIFVAAERDAQRTSRGLWDLPQREEGGGGRDSAAAGGAKGLIDGVAGIARVLSGLFGRRR